MDYRKQYLLSNDDYKFDIIPEIMDGKNIADYVDPEIEAKLAALEAEEDQLMAEAEAAGMGQDSESDLDSEEEAAVSAIREKKTNMRMESRINRKSSILPRTARGREKDMHTPGEHNTSVIAKKLGSVGVDASAILERGRERTVKRGRNDEEDGMEEDNEGKSKGEIKRAKKEREASVARENSVARSHSKVRAPSARGMRDEAMESVARKKDITAKSYFNGTKGEGDHTQTVHLVKWMNTGKKRNGTHNKR